MNIIHNHLLKNINLDLSSEVDSALRKFVSFNVYNKVSDEIFNNIVMDGEGAGFSDIANQAINVQCIIVKRGLVPISIQSSTLTSLKSL